MLERKQRQRGSLPGCCTLVAAALICRGDAFLYFPQSYTTVRTGLASTAFAPSLIENDLFGVFAADEPEEAVSLAINSTNPFPQSENQLKSIRSTSPAVLLSSGPGTGKTHTLAARVAHVLKTESCPPQNVVIMSFSNRDADVLKAKAIDQVFQPSGEDATPFKLTRAQLNERLWGGTIHKFAANIIRVYSSSKRTVRVLSNRESKMRIDRCLRQLLDENRYKEQGGTEKLREARRIHRDALVEVRQSRDVMIHQVGRCIELWKESAMLPPPSIHGIKITSGVYTKSGQKSRDNCLELATRLGITQNVAFLAWSIFPLYQDLHERQGTGDPADLVPLAYNLLLSHPEQLSKLRAKLNHIILDEYQDISVSQHSLIRLVVRGVVDELNCDDDPKAKLNIPPVLAATQNRESAYNSPFIDVPKLFCAGDSQQSIYGFRGAAPQLSVDGFRNDFPQGIVASLDKSFRLARNIWATANALLSTDGRKSFTETFEKSPVGVSKARETLFEALNQCTSEQEVESLTDMLSEDLSDDMTGTIHVQGVWDCREESKNIAMMIKRRAKERTQHIADAWKISFKGRKASAFVDPSEIAIVVRAGNQLDLIREELENARIPYVDINGKVKEPITFGPAALMKPVVLLTMHGSKGEEFDDVYLPGWTEGVFPHPSAVSCNRVDEERRLAYVAISRARHMVYITHAFVRRALHNGPNLAQKRVTMQVRPSRFLYELVPNGAYSTKDAIDNSEAVEHSEEEKHLPTITWDRSRGTKGAFAGSNVPEYFRKSYDAPKGFSAPEHPDQELLIMERQLELIKNPPTKRRSRKKEVAKRKTPDGKQNSSPIVLTPTKLTGDEYDQVLEGVNEILSGKYGSSTKHKKTFLSLLKNNFGLSRGKITLFPFEADAKLLPGLSRVSFNELLKEAPKESFSTRPLSQSTGLQLGLYLVFLLRGGETTK